MTFTELEKIAAGVPKEDCAAIYRCAQEKTQNIPKSPDSPDVYDCAELGFIIGAFWMYKRLNRQSDKQ